MAFTIATINIIDNIIFIQVGKIRLNPNNVILEKYNLKANITTNGTLLKDKLDIINNSKSVRQINISLHSSTQNELFGKQYLKDIFESVEKLENYGI